MTAPVAEVDKKVEAHTVILFRLLIANYLQKIRRLCIKQFKTLFANHFRWLYTPDAPYF